MQGLFCILYILIYKHKCSITHAYWDIMFLFVCYYYNWLTYTLLNSLTLGCPKIPS